MQVNFRRMRDPSRLHRREQTFELRVLSESCAPGWCLLSSAPDHIAVFSPPESCHQWRPCSRIQFASGLKSPFPLLRSLLSPRCHPILEAHPHIVKHGRMCTQILPLSFSSSSLYLCFSDLSRCVYTFMSLMRIPIGCIREQRQISGNLRIFSQNRTTYSLQWFGFDWKLVDVYWE